MVCLETTFLVDLLRGKKEVSELKDELIRSDKIFAIASPSIMEIWSGASLSMQSEYKKEKINELILSLTILSLDEKSAKEAGEIEAELIEKGIIIETEDIMIAAIAKVNGETLVTRDGHYAKIPGLKMLKY
jgi:predicted nucleic acid-binding protein